MFNLVEGLVDHQILGIHHVRDDLGGPLSWDLGFLAFGTILIVVGTALVGSARRRAALQRAASMGIAVGSARARLPREPEQALADDVAQDVRGAAHDRVGGGVHDVA